jgi:pseudouridine-5'-phosphate glycosidase
VHTFSQLALHPEVAAAVRDRRPVVALESTLIAHGLPWPVNLETARDAETVIRAEGAIPATIAVWQGRLTVGLLPAQLEQLACRTDVLKASRRDLAAAVAQGQTAATTVAATMCVAHWAGLRIFATGGIGGAHRGEAWDVSADLTELARTPVAVVCAGAKSILDLPRTLEILETAAVPVVGYGTDEFPAFYVHSSGERVSARVDTPVQTAALLATHWSMNGAGVVLAQPVAKGLALSAQEFEAGLAQASSEAAQAHVRGKALTPFLLARLARATNGRTLQVNRSLVVANACLAAQVASALQNHQLPG